jgi:hypothetical protein
VGFQTSYLPACEKNVGRNIMSEKDFKLQGDKVVHLNLNPYHFVFAFVSVLIFKCLFYDKRNEFCIFIVQKIT